MNDLVPRALVERAFQELANRALPGLPPGAWMHVMAYTVARARHATGLGLPITSFDRSPNDNALVDGAPRSLHLRRSRAVDLGVEDGPSAYSLMLQTDALWYAVKGVGVYSSHIHLDTRTAPARVLWVDLTRR